jgi:hypothetical protein
MPASVLSIGGESVGVEPLVGVVAATLAAAMRELPGEISGGE